MAQQTMNNNSYGYVKIVAPGTNLSLCIVVKQNNTVVDIGFLPQPSSGDFLYHRWDLNQRPDTFCRQFNRYATQAKSTVKLTPDAFIEAYSYTGVKETEVRVKQYKDYLSGDLFTNPGIQKGRISRSLIRKGIMYRQPCRDTGNIKEQFTYRYRDSLCIRLYDERSIRVAVFVCAKSSGSTECPGIQR
uniref:VWFA and cache domain-containing protein 1 n=1 Tax=Magallana gigas TaxID=29159 RepID=K1PRF9_MAGGI